MFDRVLNLSLLGEQLEAVIAFFRAPQTSVKLIWTKTFFVILGLVRKAYSLNCFLLLPKNTLNYQLLKRASVHFIN